MFEQLRTQDERSYSRAEVSQELQDLNENAVTL